MKTQLDQPKLPVISVDALEVLQLSKSRVETAVSATVRAEALIPGDQVQQTISPEGIIQRTSSTMVHDNNMSMDLKDDKKAI